MFKAVPVLPFWHAGIFRLTYGSVLSKIKVSNDTLKRRRGDGRTDELEN